MPFWLPTLLAIVVTALALTATGSPPAAPNGRRLWMAGILVFGCLAIAATVWLARREAEETAALAGTSAAPSGLPGSRARSIAQTSADDLAAHLSQLGSRRVIVSCIPDDLEAYRYANQLVNILKAAHWKVQGPQVTKIFGDVRSPGINVYVNGDDHSDTAQVLLDGFAKFNIPYQSRVTPSGAIPDTETIELFVGTKQSQRASAGAD